MKLFKRDQVLPVTEKSNWWPENKIRLRNMRLAGPPQAQAGDTEIYFQPIMKGLEIDNSEILLYYITVCHIFLEKLNYQISQTTWVALVEVRKTLKVTWNAKLVFRVQKSILLVGISPDFLQHKKLISEDKYLWMVDYRKGIRLLWALKMSAGMHFYL